MEEKNSMSKKGKLAILIAAVVFVVAITVMISSCGSNKKKPEENLKTEATSTLEKVLEIDELSTIEYTYNAIASRCNDKGEIVYYVSYDGVVSAGIEFSEIETYVDSDQQIILVKLPKVKIIDKTVDMATLEFIFLDKKFETETVTQEAYKLCLADLESRIKSENILFENAKENAKSVVQALYEPFLESAFEGYEVRFE